MRFGKDIEKVGMRELRKNIPKYLYGHSPLEVVRHGLTIGYYFPIQQMSKAVEIEALKAIAEQLEKILKDKGITEDELVDDFRRMRAAVDILPSV